MADIQDKSYSKSVILLAGLWATGMILAAHNLIFQRIPFLVDAAACTPLIVLGLACTFSRGFRKYILSLDARLLTMLESWRVVGFTLLALSAYHVSPPEFSAAGGYGDLMIGLSAPLAALFLSTHARRRYFIAWHIFGICDLLIAITLSVLSAPAVNFFHSDLTTAALAVLPLSLVPTLLVPMFLGFHLICIAQARGWGASGSIPSRTRIASQPITID